MTDPTPPDNPPGGNHASGEEGTATTSPTPLPEPSGERLLGVVKWYSLAKGYGFVVISGRDDDIFVHHSAIKEAGETEPLVEGEHVELQVEDTPRGQRARHVRRVG